MTMTWRWGMAAMVLAGTMPATHASAFCVGGGRLTFESGEAIAAWRFVGNGGVDYGQRNFPPAHQARTRNEPEYANNGWLFGRSGWFAMERVIHSSQPIEFLSLTAYLQRSLNLPPIQVALLNARTGELVEERTIDVAAPRPYADFFVSFGRAGMLMPPELLIRFSYWAPNEDAWLRVGSVDIRHNTQLFDCNDNARPLGELF